MMMSTAQLPAPESYAAIGWLVAGLLALLGLPTAILMLIYYYRAVSGHPQKLDQPITVRHDEKSPVVTRLAVEYATKADFERYVHDFRHENAQQMQALALRMDQEQAKREDAESDIREILANVATISAQLEETKASIQRVEMQYREANKESFNRLNQVVREMGELVGMMKRGGGR